MEINMALVETKVKIDLDDIVYIVKHLSKAEKETFLLMLSGDDKVLKKRFDEIKKGKVKTLTHEEVFKNV